jgi:hypothetical protein
MPKFVLSHLLEGKKVMALGRKVQCHPHSSWRASDDSRFIILMSLVKNFDAMCNFLFGMQTRNRISLHHAKNADIMSVRWWIVKKYH